MILRKKKVSNMSFKSIKHKLFINSRCYPLSIAQMNPEKSFLYLLGNKFDLEHEREIPFEQVNQDMNINNVGTRIFKGKRNIIHRSV